MKDEKKEVKEVKVDKTDNRLAALERIVGKLVKMAEVMFDADFNADGKVGGSSIATMLITAFVTVVLGLSPLFAAEEILVRWDAPEGKDAVLELNADERDDAADVGELIMTASGYMKIDVGGTTAATFGAGTLVTGGVITDNNTSSSTPGYLAPVAGSLATYYTFTEEFLDAGYIPNAASSMLTTNSQVIQRGGMFSETADQAAWLVTVTDSDSDNDESITVADNAKGGWIVANTTDKANDALNIQRNGESFGITTTKDLWFDCKFEIEDVSEDAVFVGLTVADTDILGSLGNDFMGFYLSESTNVSFRFAKNGTIVTNAAITTMVDAVSTVGQSAKRFSFYADGSASNVYVYVDGVLVATTTASTSVPNDEALSPAFCIKTTDTGADYLRIDYIDIKATR